MGEVQGKCKFRYPLLKPACCGLEEVISHLPLPGTEIWTRKIMPCHLEVARRYGLGHKNGTQRRSWGVEALKMARQFAHYVLIFGCKVKGLRGDILRYSVALEYLRILEHSAMVN